MKKEFTLLLLGLLGLGLVCAQETAGLGNDEKPPLPDPILRRAPDLAQWTITARSLGGASGGDGTKSQPPRSDTVVKSGKNYHIDTVELGGVRWDKWYLDGTQVTFRAGVPGYTIQSSGGGPFYTNFSGSDFPDLGWISEANYTGLKKAKGFEGYLFHEEQTEEKSGAVYVREALVDKATLLPVYTMSDNVVTVYKFDKPPLAPLSIPKKVLDALRAQRDFSTGKTH